jgi:hypothetical protein
LSPLPIDPERLGLLDIGALRTLVASAEQDHPGLTLTPEIDPVSGAKVHPELRNAVAYRLAISKIPRFHAAQTNPDAGLGALVAQGLKPVAKRLASVLALVAQQLDQSSL